MRIRHGSFRQDGLALVSGRSLVRLSITRLYYQITGNPFRGLSIIGDMLNTTSSNQNQSPKGLLYGFGSCVEGNATTSPTKEITTQPHQLLFSAHGPIVEFEETARYRCRLCSRRRKPGLHATSLKLSQRVTTA